MYTSRTLCVLYLPMCYYNNIIVSTATVVCRRGGGGGCYAEFTLCAHNVHGDAAAVYT